MSERIGWLDCSAGVAGDMLLGALVDAGVPAGELADAIQAVVPDSVDLVVTAVTRAGLRATKVDVRPLVEQPPQRTWADIEQLLRGADLPTGTRDHALATFGRLAGAEARVHGIPVADVHFHEVGALDSIADVVGVCAGFDQLGLDRLLAGRVALGSGSTRGAHGQLAVPVPAVLELSAGWPVTSGGEGELTTPTGLALVRALAYGYGELPRMTVERVGIGAGTRDVPGRANVTRLVVGTGSKATADVGVMTVLETNVDDLDPRLWPGVLTALLESGAVDAWLTPVLAKKGRPAHVLSVLAAPDREAVVRDVVLARTSSLGVRAYDVRRYALPRTMIEIALDGETVAVKIGHRDGVVLQVTPEFADVSAYAARHGRTETEVMAEALAVASARGYRSGAPLPE